tara:strand:- start:523 stop:1047 length:525 start_codon:yes stop_codon:yes gene_type:complete
MTKDKKQNYWTQEEQLTIESFIKKGISHNETVRQLHKIFNNRTLHSINLKLSRMKNPNTKITNPFFYSEEIVDSMKESLRSTETIENIADRFAKLLNKSSSAVLAKLNSLSKKMPERKKTKFSKVEPVKSLAKISAKKELQQPAEIGIEVPHGMTFEGTPKKIMLHSDHFRIYF